MKISYYLKQEKNKAGESPIRVSIFLHGTHLMQSIGIAINPDMWDKGAEQVKVTKEPYVNSKGLDTKVINKRISDITTHFNNFDLITVEAPTLDEMKAELQRAITKSAHFVAALHEGATVDAAEEKSAVAANVPLNKKPAYDYIDEYLKERGREAIWTYETAKMNKTLKTYMAKYSKTVPLSHFNREGLIAYVDYLRFTRNLEDTSASKQYRILTAFLNWAQQKRYIDLPDVATYHPVFKTPKKPVIFLTKQELEKLYTYKVPKSGKTVKLRDMCGHEYEKTVREPGALEKTRDLFCFCAFTSLRYSDMANVHLYDIQDGVLTVTTQKTNARLQIKLHENALAILDKYKNCRFPRDLALPVISNQKMNQYLKDLCELCGFNQPIHVTGFRNGQRYDETYPKYSLVSTHCGRKTFICFMLSIGVAPQVVMKFTGHADYKSMKPYIDIADSAKTEAIEAMEKAMRGEPKKKAKKKTTTKKKASTRKKKSE